MNEYEEGHLGGVAAVGGRGLFRIRSFRQRLVSQMPFSDAHGVEMSRMRFATRHPQSLAFGCLVGVALQFLVGGFFAGIGGAVVCGSRAGKPSDVLCQGSSRGLYLDLFCDSLCVVALAECV